MKRKGSKADFIRKLRRLEEEFLSRSRSDSEYDSENDRHTGSCSPSPIQSPTEEIMVEDVPVDLMEEQTGQVTETQEANGAVVHESTEAIPTIPQEILAMLGEAKKLETPLGAKIPTEIAERWDKILINGLEKNQKEQLMNQLLIPENFLLARAPTLNIEVSSIISDASKKRDSRMETAQNQLGTGIAGLATLTKDLIYTDMRKLDIIKKISEISQILLDLHYEETMNRRRLIVPLLDKNFLMIIKGVKRDGTLFGEKLGEQIKNSKMIEKSSQQIKKPATPVYKKPVQNQQGNFRAPPRPTNAPRPPPARRDPAPAPAARRPAATTRSRPQARSNDRKHRR